MHRSDHKIKKSRETYITERQTGMYGAMATSKPSDKAREIFRRPVFGTGHRGGNKK